MIPGGDHIIVTEIPQPNFDPSGIEYVLTTKGTKYAKIGGVLSFRALAFFVVDWILGKIALLVQFY
jgi:hypothetical protein